METSHRKAFTRTTFIALAIIIIALIILVSSYTYENILLELKMFFSASSRIELYEEAIDLFAKYPIFGVGLGYMGEAIIETSGLVLYNFHSVILHVMATMGVFGIIVYLIYYIVRFKILMHSGSTSSLFLTIAFIMFECYALIDTAEFNAIPLMTTLTVMITVVECANKQKSNAVALPFLL
jgi:O-antigen ligase